MKVLVCGGRDFLDKEAVNKALNEIHELHPITCIIEGGARGADALAKLWAQERGIPIMEFPANWDFYGRSAGPVRNEWMLNFGCPELVVAFPGGAGTANMIKQSRAYGVPVNEERKR